MSEKMKMFFFVRFPNPLDVSAFRNVFYYQNEYFDNNEKTIPIAFFGDLSNIESFQVFGLDEKTKMPILFPETGQPLKEVTLEVLESNISIPLEVGIKIENYESGKPIETLNKMHTAIKGLNDKDVELFVFSSCMETLKKECITRICDKCPLNKDIASLNLLTKKV